MKKIVLPILMTSLGAGGGFAAGTVLHKPAELPNDATIVVETLDQPKAVEFAKLNNQFVVPIMTDGRMSAMVVLSLTLEVAEGSKDTVYAIEPRLRDSLFSAMIEHANLGGFDGDFTQTAPMRQLRNVLVHAAQKPAADLITDVLILDIARQDL